MKLKLNEKTFAYELENVARMFTRELTVEITHDLSLPKDGEDEAAAGRCILNDTQVLNVDVHINGRDESGSASLPHDADDKTVELEMAKLLFSAFSRATGRSPEWGVITGIRPAKFARRMLEQSSPDEVRRTLHERYYVSPRKASLCVETALASMAAQNELTDRSFSLYISIPFCPTRCSYCSFVSKTIEREKHLVQPYVERLCDELAYSGEIARSLGLRLESIYMGGGTPTTLSAEQLAALCRSVGKSFDVSTSREFTVEAGRPDTITPEKLAALRENGVSRISINPQTANDSVLRAVGRTHTAADIELAFEQARAAGFDNINADLIAGLPTDTFASFEHTLNWLLAMDPENITVHALTLKRASNMTERGESASGDATRMVALANDVLPQHGYAPYYMYKQKGTIDSLENTGYAKPGMQCLYNIYIMDELHTIIACGAGAVTKLVNRRTGLINRIFDYKYPAEYLEGFDEMLRRKKGMTDFYGTV